VIWIGIIWVLAVGGIVFLLMQNQGVFVGDPDLTVTVTVSPDPVKRGGGLTYTIQLDNIGGGEAVGVVLTDTLSPNVRFVSSTPGFPSCKESAGVVTCNAGSMQAGARGTIAIRVMVEPSAQGTISNKAVLTSQAEEPLENNTAMQETSVE
jgi:uncharacterized repeat protein (TIGR01451 family)